MSERSAFDPHAVELPLRPGVRLKDLVLEYEKTLLRQALERSGWNQQEVAWSLCLLPSTLSEKMKRFGLRIPRTGGSDPSSAP